MTYTLLTRVQKNSPFRALLVRVQKNVTYIQGHLELVKKTIYLSTFILIYLPAICLHIAISVIAIHSKHTFKHTKIHGHEVIHRGIIFSNKILGTT